MTVLCGGGTSAIKAGVSDTVILSAGILTGALLAVEPWLFPFAALLDTLAYDALTQCPSDPPAMPVFSASDVIALGLPLADTAATTTALGKVRDVLLNWAWLAYCHCTSGALVPPTYPAQPAGVTTVLPGQTGQCFQSSWNGTGQLVAPATTPVFANMPQLTPPSLATSTQHWSGGYDVTTVQLPPGATGAVVGTWTLDPVSAGGGHVAAVLITFFDQTGTQLAGTGELWSAFTSLGASVTQTRTVTVPAGAFWAGVCPFADTRDSNVHQSLSINWFCGSGASSPAVAQCCTDPVVYGMLQNIWQYVQLLQRQLIPFAYVTGTAHAGLTDQGTLAPAAPLVGVLVELTTVPTQLGEEIGEPTVIFDAGWVSVLDANGFIEETRIRATTRVWLPRIMSDATVIGYSFHAGVVATITELLREA